jgi:UDP-glucose:glycoprotein glucosyltransferase
MFLFLILGGSVRRPDARISVSVFAPWIDTPWLEHMTLFVGSYGSDVAFAFLKRIASVPQSQNNREAVWSVALDIIPPDAVPLAQTLLDFKFFLPRVEMFRRLAATAAGDNFGDILIIGENPKFDYPGPFISRDTLPHTYTFDIQFGKTSTFLYANLHNQSVLNYVVALIEEKAQFILRPIPPVGCLSATLRGYGAEVRPVDAPPDFNASIPYQTFRQETFEPQLGWLREPIPDYRLMNLSSIDNINARFVTFVSKYRNVSLPELLRDMTNNWPLFVQILAGIEPDLAATGELLNELQDKRDFILLNGRLITMKNLDVFTFLETYLEENTLRQLFQRVLNVQTDEIFRTPTSIEASYVLDFRTEAMVWFNDIETDPVCANWSTDMRDLVQSPDEVIHVRKNLAHVVCYLDPSTPDNLFAIYRLTNFIEEGLPVRLGVVPFFEVGHPLTRKVAFAFHHIADYNSRDALQWLISVLLEAGLNHTSQSWNEMTEAHFASKYAQVTSRSVDWDELHNLYVPTSQEFGRIRRAHDYFKFARVKRGSVMMNGKPLSLTNGIQGLYSQVRSMLVGIGKLAARQGVSNVTDIDLMGLLSENYLVVPSIDAEQVAQSLMGIGLTKLGYSKLKEFVKIINELEWCDMDEPDATSFWIYFGPENDVLDEFIDESHCALTRFAKNPVKLRDFLELTENETFLIVNGRIYPEIVIENMSQLRSIDRWSMEFVWNYCNQFRNALKTPLAQMIFACLLIDWRESGIIREASDEYLWSQDYPILFKSQNQHGVKVDFIANPFSRDFQRFTDFLCYLESHNLCSFRFLVLPSPNVSYVDNALGVFYRGPQPKNTLIFSGLDDRVTWAVQPIVPSSWLIDLSQTTFDVDCFTIQDRPEHAEFLLTNVLAEGKCVVPGKQMVDGVDISVFSQSGKVVTQPVISATNGYWQLALTPGEFPVELASDLSRRFYDMRTSIVSISTFARREFLLRPELREGVTRIDFSIANFSHNELNILSVASGRFQEHLLKITILSILRTAKAKVTFWIIQYFPSAKLKAMMRTMAIDYGFDYKLLSYSWPAWLRTQGDKSKAEAIVRLLFIDLVLPFDLDRIIFVEPGQVVRTDLTELMYMDMGSFPYALVKFCDGAPGVPKHWDTTFWRHYLRNRSYYSSSLFVLNLPQYRQLSMGEWVRYVYQEMSADPWNFDQLENDILNFLQDRQAVISLPPEWGWCSSLCPMESMAKAMVVRVCEPPGGKPRDFGFLRRNLPEWRFLEDLAFKIDQ